MGGFIFGSGGGGGSGLNWDEITMQPQFGLAGKKFFDKDKQLKTGSIPNWDGYTIKGEPSGPKHVVQSSRDERYIPAGNYLGVDVDLKPITPSNIYFKGVHGPYDESNPNPFDVNELLIDYSIVHGQIPAFVFFGCTDNLVYKDGVPIEPPADAAVAGWARLVGVETPIVFWWTRSRSKLYSAYFRLVDYPDEQKAMLNFSEGTGPSGYIFDPHGLAQYDYWLMGV